MLYIRSQEPIHFIVKILYPLTNLSTPYPQTLATTILACFYAIDF